ncbi:efflux RND transporter periplasmic adaptor subunit [Pseudothauera nasutitermitis]|uniref:Efflux RND transporter periplasmic adaptor subunit n=1 Tax=Pseudothauera nasutitermitis TaxID=2565930 RepID=A0A4S4AXB4_9RHOO|nr:efflux RND transporter periplasmic adaptor subunit [Pseudothauera nasutitermitis]THF64725.1 efflux RND transporter periplasmic adaptor subunit [Pseudothauera nasutitermitis]
MTSIAPTRRSRRLRTLLAAALLILGTAGGYFAWKHYNGVPTPEDLYQFATVQRADIEDLVTATGTLQPRDYVDVGAQVSGQLKVFHVEVGSEVKAGDLLAEIDATVLQSKVDATHAQLRNLRATLGARESDLKLAEIQHRRQQNLIAENATTEEAVQQAQAGLLSARAQIEALRAQIDQTESNLRADEANLDYARIYAPIDGTVVSISARQGQTLNSTQQAPTILRVADLSSMTVETQVSEADVSRLRQGMEAYFTTLGNPGQRWTGQLRKVEPTPTVTNNVVLYNALFDVPNPDRRLMTQMTAQVFFVVGRAENALTVPMGALSNLGTRTRPPGMGAEGGPGMRPAGGERPAAGERPAMQRPPGAPNGEGGMRRARAAEGEDGAGGPPVERGRRATVKVLQDGEVVEREVRVGVTSRVAAQVLDGLSEGERVVAGARQSGAQTGGQGQPPGPMPRMR